MSKLTDRIAHSSLDRRTFLEGMAAATAATAALAATGCASENKIDDGEGTQSIGYTWDVDKALAEAEEKGEWIPVTCLNTSGSCGGRCVNKVLVYDGVVVRSKTDDTSPDGETGRFQNRSCLRGRAQQQIVFGADRLKYPMKRKNWQPGGEQVNGELRGIDEWERISWDDAIDMIVSETKRIYENYGPRSVLHAAYGSGVTKRILAAMGGFVDEETADSYGSWMMTPRAFGSTLVNYNPDMGTINDRYDMANADTIVIMGGNPAWASAGSPMHFYRQAKDAGVEFIIVGPSRNVSAAVLDAEWVPVRPGTDTAFLLGVAHEMIEKGYYDQDFLDTYTVGFDGDHMPEDAKLDENFKDYVLGAYDDQPKTPEWASAICGTPVDQIKWFAEKISKDHKVMLHHSYPSGRCNGAENLPQLFMAIGAMGAHMGKSGHCAGCMYNYDAANGGPRLVRFGSAPGPNVPNPNDDVLPGPNQWKAIVDGKYTFTGQNTMVSMNLWKPAEERDLDIRMIWACNNNELQSRIDVNMGVRAFRKVEFVLAANFHPSLTCQYADIVLPVQTQWEGCNQLPLSTWGNREIQTFGFPVVEECLYESHPDEWYAERIAEKLGLNTAELFPMPYEKMWIYEILTGEYFDGGKLRDEETSVSDQMPETGTWNKVFTVTKEELEQYGYPEGEPQEGAITLDEARRTGLFQVDTAPGDGKGWIAYKDFIDDPVAHPRLTPSGKMEIYCQTKADLLNNIGINPEPLKPYPTYIVPVNGYETAQENADYPFQMYTPHYLRREHTTFDNAPWLQEAMVNPIFLNASDAEAKGIKTGDTVLVSSAAGKILRRASVLESIMPGCVAVPHGARSYFDEETGIDLGGSENTLSCSVLSNYYPQSGGFNTVLVNYEKYDGPELPLDYERSYTIG